MEDKVKEWYNKLTDFCKDKSFTLSNQWERVVKGLIRRNGDCPCRLVSTPCPCPFHVEEIEKTGSCHCGLFIKKEK